MTDLATWTHLAIGALILVPLVVFAFFLRDAAALLREMKEGRGTSAPPRPPPVRRLP